jgi:hypothetical protein
VGVDWEATDRKLLQLDEIFISPPGFKKNSLLETFCNFLGSFPLTLSNAHQMMLDGFWFRKILKGKPLYINYVAHFEALNLILNVIALGTWLQAQ